MNSILKKILLVAKDVAETSVSQVIPGSGLAIGGIEKLLDKEKDNDVQALIELETGIISAINSLKKSKVVDQNQLNAGILELKSAFDHIKGALTPDTEV